MTIRLLRSLAVLALAAALNAWAGVEDDVRVQDDKRHEGLSTNNMDLWTSVMADDVVYIHSSGMMDVGKDQLTAPFRKGELKIKSFAREVLRVRVVNDNLVQVIGKGTPTVVRGDKEMTFNILYTSTWTRAGGGWKMTHWQATRAPEK